jgi:hypothetical protein
MKLELIDSLVQLRKANLVSEDAFAEGIKYALNGHAAPSVPQQQLPLVIKPRQHKTHLRIDQIDAIVEMACAGHGNDVIADTMNKRYSTKLTRRAICAITNDIRTGKKQKAQRYQATEWIAAFAKWKALLGQ